MINFSLNGLFEAASFALLRWAGLRDVVTPDYHARREADIDRLADAVEQHLDTAMLAKLFALDGVR
jgi:adenosylcobyric acid synthase